MNNKNTEGVVYEIGFHLIPLVTEDEVASHVSTIKSILGEAGAEIISEEFPTLIELAYEISKKVKGTRHEFGTGYFGWIKFETTADKIAEIDEGVRAVEEVLRYIVVKTLPGETMIKHEEEEEEGEEEVTEEESETPKEPAASSDNIDKTIDELVIE